MSSPSERRRNNVKAGILVTATIVLAATVLATLADAPARLRPKVGYTLVVPVGSGVSGLAVGSEVKVGGLRRGIVSKIDLDSRGGPATHVEVLIELERDITLYPNAVATIEVPLLGSGGWINFESVGDSTGGPVMSAGESIDVRTGSGMLGRFVGAEQAERFERIFGDVEDLIARLRADYAEISGNAKVNIDQSLGDIAQLVALLRHDYTNRWREPFGESVESLPALVEQIDGVVVDASAAVGELREGVASARAVIDDNRASLDQIVVDVAEAVARFRSVGERTDELLIGKLTELFTLTEATLIEVGGTVSRFNEELDIGAPRVQRILADVQLASQQLKVTMFELNRAPWRVMYRPTDAEVSHENLFSAARNFALAAGDLQATADAVERVFERHGARLDADPELSSRLQQLIEQSFERFEGAQRALYSTLLGSE